ncbi:MAG: protein-L-isoaspartate O-methyltransferase [Candidatus Parcubacteria bacterium]|nr:MAG: protein-L-isoaspartate O-methyltransferase [Candidatus Parcubacteria bacterium]
MFFKKKEELINYLIRNNILKTENIINAFLKIDRKDFVRPENLFEAYADYPLPIGNGQTISQPWTVAFMLELLQPQEGIKILDVGFGSGWTTALLAQIVSDKGKVYGIEIFPEIFEFGKNNIEKYNFFKKNIVKLKLGDGSKGWKEYSPFDRILVNASTDEIPSNLIEQLNTNGIMIIPDKEGINQIFKDNDGNIEKRYYYGFKFVPLLSQ